ncbi:hypothetical protein F8388_008206 [Cannabis sativa]|uniref:KEN domain-containing protein n=1 Tax=Cannabis sativa TaxID=3483 RepID=A0A7J6EV63_CANSA|nr:hypothetical protein F8388_008206 [Cannabis sativa]KAF4391334.1 hypothetical protein G4B88_016644 [Cannabis sativa]
MRIGGAISKRDFSIMAICSSNLYYPSQSLGWGVLTPSTTQIKIPENNIYKPIWYLLWEKLCGNIRCWNCNANITISGYDHNQYIGNLGDLMANQFENITETFTARPTSKGLIFIRDIIEELNDFNNLGKVYLNLTPSNILVRKEVNGILRAELAKNTCMTKTSEYSSSDCNKFGWKANDAAETIKGNMFSFGHPFGDDPYSREYNIEHNNMVNENILINFPEALDLISRLLSVNPLDRPTAVDVLNHPFMWKSEKKKDLICDAGDLEKNHPLLSQALESISVEEIIATDHQKLIDSTTTWDQFIDEAIISHMTHFSQYDFTSVRSLIRFIRNLCIHYKQRPKYIKDLIGVRNRNDLYDNYFTIIFPKLFMKKDINPA